MSSSKGEFDFFPSCLIFMEKKPSQVEMELKAYFLAKVGTNFAIVSSESFMLNNGQ